MYSKFCFALTVLYPISLALRLSRVA